MKDIRSISRFSFWHMNVHLSQNLLFKISLLHCTTFAYLSKIYVCTLYSVPLIHLSILLPMSKPKLNPKTNYWHYMFYGLDKCMLTYIHHCNMIEYFHCPTNSLYLFIISALSIPPAATDLLTISISLPLRIHRLFLKV